MRACVINLTGVGLAALSEMPELWAHSLPAAPGPLSPSFPAVPASVQATMTTGQLPGVHGIVADGLFRRQCATVSFAERSNTLLAAKRFWHARALPRRPQVGLVFWSNPLAGGADVVVGAGAYAQARIDDASEQPEGLWDYMTASFGNLGPEHLWSPSADASTSQWIADVAIEVWRLKRLDLMWVCLGGADLAAVRHGVDSPQFAQALTRVDAQARRIAEVVQDDGGVAVVVSDGGMVPVSRFAEPNARLAREGLLTILHEQGDQRIDFENSRAFAMVDQQISHLYCRDASVAEDAAAILADDPAVSAVVAREELFAAGLGHDRAGEWIILAEPDAWLSYRWWSGEEPAPPVAITTDAACKGGLDLCELLPPTRSGDPMDAEPGHVRAARGLVDGGPARNGFIAASRALPQPCAEARGLPGLLQRLMFEA